jgi:hypothetical protein
MWWEYVVIVAALILGVYAFVSIARWQTGILTRKTDRTAEDLYDSYGRPARRRHRTEGPR